MNEYQRNGSPESSIWKTDIDRFQGYVRAKLEDLAEEQKTQWTEHTNTNKRVKTLETRAQYALGGFAIVNIVILAFFAAYGAGLIKF